VRALGERLHEQLLDRGDCRLQSSEPSKINVGAPCSFASPAIRLESSR
jgi:hypothetical protein